MHKSALYIRCFVICAMLLPPTPALSLTATNSSDRFAADTDSTSCRPRTMLATDRTLGDAGHGVEQMARSPRPRIPRQ